MEDQNQNTVTDSLTGGVEQPLTSDVSVAPAPDETGALSLDPGPLDRSVETYQEFKKPRNSVKLLKRVDVLLVLLLVVALVVVLVMGLLHKKPITKASVADNFNTVQIPLNGFVAGVLNGSNFADHSVKINGALSVNGGLVVVPSVQPNAPATGQLYYDQNTNQLAYYNGTSYVALTAQGAMVQSLGGSTGAITLGGGLNIVGNQLSVVFPAQAQTQTQAGVTSLGGLNGDITLGAGLKSAGAGIQNAGVITLSAGTPNLVVANDGDGNLTISSIGGGSGTVTSGGGTTGHYAKFNGVQDIEDSLLSESGSTITAGGDLSVSGNLNVTGSVALGSALTVANGGTGTGTLTNNAVLIGQGSGPLTGVTAVSSGLCLVSTGGAPVFQACPSGNGVTTLNGLTGALTIANATGSVNTITINDASASGKGIASFNATNFTVSSGAVNTTQDINTGSSPTFAGVNTNNITPSGALSIGSTAQNTSLQGAAGSTFAVTGNGHTTTVGFNGTATGDINYNFDRTATGGTYTICTTAANCAGVGGQVTTAGGTANRITKFLSGQTIGDSSLSDDGSLVTVNGTANLVVQGGTATLGTLTQSGSLKLSDGSNNTVTIVASNLSADRIYTLPDAGGNAALCIDSGNCIGGGGSAPNTADYLVANLNGTLTNERALAGGSNISLTDGGANANMTVATVMNPTFTTSVTTPVLQSSGALTITSAAGQTIAIDAGTTIELQDSVNVTGDLDVSAAFKAGTANAFSVSSGGAITAATGINSSGTIVFSGLNCTTFANGGALTADASGNITCTDDDGGAGGAISGSGTSGTVALFSGANSITNSIITQSGTSVTIAGDLTLNNVLTVGNGGTGANTFTAHGMLFGNGTGALGVTSAGTGGQVLIADGTGTPTFASFTGDVGVSATGLTTIQANSVALGTDTTGNYVANLGTLTGLTTSGNTGEGSTPTLSVNYGAIANTAVQGNVTLTCPAGSGNLSGGGGVITLGSGGGCGNLSTVNNPTFTTSVTTPSLVLTGTGSNGSIVVGNLGQGTIYTLPDPGAGAATICISTGNCATSGTAGGDLTGSYPNPTIAKLQGTNLSISGPVGGNILVYNATSSQWVNQAITGDIAISESGVAAVQANAVALGTDTTGNYVLGLSAGNGASVTGSAGEGWTPTVSVLYGATANTAVQGNTSISVTAGTNITGGGSITLGSGGSVTVNVASSPTFSGTLVVQGATATVGTAVQQGSVVLHDGSSNTGTVQTAPLAQNTTFTLPDPGSSSATICLSTGNCAGSGSGVTTVGGTTNQLSKFTGSQAIGDSVISDDGSTVTINGTANLVVQGGTATIGTLTQAGALAVSDGSSNTVSIVASALAADRVYTLPDAGGAADFCLSSGNCIGGGGGGAPANAAYLVATLNGSLTSERALASGTNISITDGGANGNMTVATVANPTFSTNVTTPVLQSSGALTITSAAGQTVAIDAGTTIELQDSTNVTGSLDVSASFTAGTANAFTINSAGAIAAATGLTTAGSVRFSSLNCTTFANGGALTTDASGNVSCSDDDGGAGGAISGSGTSGTVALFNGTNSITNSIITQASTFVTIAGDLTLSNQLTVGNGGTGATSFTAHGLLFGNGTATLGVTAAGTGGQVLIADGSGVPAFVSFTGDVAVSNTGATTIQANSVALGTDTTGNYVANLGTLTGLTTTGNTGEGATPTLSVTYGAIANTAVQGNVAITCTAGTGNLSGGGNSVTLGTGGGCNDISTVNNPTFSTSVTTPNLTLTGAGSNGSIVVGNLGQGTVYTLPDPGSASTTICIATGNCATAGAAGGDLTGNYPNPTIAKLQGTNLAITGPAGGNILVYNATSSQWINQAITGDIAINENGLATIQANSVALSTDTTGNYVLGLSAGNGASVSGTAGEGWTPTVSVLYGATANTAVQGNAGITVTAGTNLSGGGSITLGAGGTVTLDVSNSPTFSGTLVVQGATASVGTAAQQGSVVLSDGSSNTGTVRTAALGQNTTFTLPDPGASSATICLSTGNCAGSGSGVTTTGGTTNRVSKFTGAQALGDSTISDDGSTVTINGTANLVVQGGTGTIGTLTQAGTLNLSDGSSNTVSIVASALAADRVYTLPDAGGPADICLSSGNCIGGGGGGAPANAAYLVTTLNGSLSNERALASGTNISITDGGANGNMTVATVANPTFSTSVTTPVLQSSGALTITSAAGQTIAIDAGTTIELQDSTNITGSLDISASFTAGTSNAFTISSGGAITAATGLTTSGSVTFGSLNCTTFANGGALTTDSSGNVSCSDDDGSAGGAITGTGTSGTVALFTGTNAIGNSIVTQASTTISIAGSLSLSNALSVANGGTGTGAGFTTHGVLYGNGTGALGVSGAGTSGQVMVADGSGVPGFVSFTGDVAVSNTGATTIQANSVALGTDTTGNYVANLGTLTGLTTSGNTGEGSTPTLSVTYGAIANTAVQGSVTLTCPAGTGNLSGGGSSITLGSGGSCGNINTISSPTFSTSVTTPSVIMSGAGSNGTLQVATLGQATTYTLPDPGAGTASICLSTGNCTAIGTAGGDLTGSYPNPTIAKLQGTTVSVTSLTTGNILQYNGTNWVNQSLSGDVALSSTAVATIQPSSVTSGKIADGTIANIDLASGSFGNITGVGTLGALTVVGTTALNTTGTANTAIGNSTGTFQLTSNGGLNVSTGGALTGVTGITTSGGYTQSGIAANALTGATTLSATGTALTVSNNATINGTLTVNNITPNSTLTIGATSQNLTLQGSATTVVTATNGGFTTTLGFVTPTANATLNLPALAAGTYTVCTSSGNCAGVGSTLQTAYNFSTNPEIVLDATRGALTIRDASSALGANLLEVQSNNGSTTYFNVTSAGTNTTGTSVTSGNINSTSGALQTAGVDRVDNGGNLVNIGTVTTSGAINSQTIGSAANFTGTVTIQGANALTLGTASGNTGAIVLRGSGNANTLKLQGPNAPAAGNFTLSIPAISASANICTDNSVCTGYAAATGAGGYIQNQTGLQTSSNFHISSIGQTDGSFVTPLLQSATGTALTVTGTTGLTANTAATNTASTASGDISIATGNATGSTSNSGSITINNGTANGAAGGTISIGTANTSAISLGRTGITTTSNGSIALAANQNLSLATGTGTILQGYSNTTGTASTLNLADTASSGATTVIGQAINITGTANAGGSNAISGINFANVAAATNNSYYGINVGTGLTDILRYNGAQLISGTGLVQNAAIDSTLSYTNIQKVGGLTSGTINTGFGSITTTAAIQGGTGTFTGANSLTLGTASSSIGAILFKGSGGAGTLTLAGPTTPSTFTLSLPAISANATVCTTNSVCAGYAATGSYIQNQSASQQPTSSFWVSSASRVDGILTVPTISAPSDLTLQSGNNDIILNGIDTVTASGTLTLLSGGNNSINLNAGGTGIVNVGVSLANKTINIGAVGSTANTTTINIGNSTAAAQTISIGSTNSTSTTTIQAGSGGINLNSASITLSGTNPVVLASGTNTLRIDTGGAAALSIGDTNATTVNVANSSTNAAAVNIANNNTAHTINIGTGAAANTIGIGSTTGGVTTIQGSNTVFQTSSSTLGSLFRTTTNSTAALQVQNSTNDQVFNLTTVAKTNLLTNPGFETVTTAPWAAVNGGTIALTRNTSQFYAQTASMQVAITTATQWAGAKYPISLTNGSSYTLSFMVKSSSGATAINAGYSRTGLFSGEAGCVSNFPAISTAGWTRVSCTFTAGAASGSPYVYIEIPTATISTFWLDNVQLTQTSTDNGGYYSGLLDFSGSAINGQLTVQPTNDSTGALQVFSSGGTAVLAADTVNQQVMMSKLVVADDFSDPSKDFRIRTTGSGLDLESAGTGVAGELWLSGWAGPNFTGTQVNFLRMSQVSHLIMVGQGTSTTTPMVFSLDSKSTTGDPSYFNGGMYYNANDGKLRCAENGEWRNCVSSVTTATSSVANTSSANPGTGSYANYPGTSSVNFTKSADSTQETVTATVNGFANTIATNTIMKLGITVSDIGGGGFVTTTSQCGALGIRQGAGWILPCTVSFSGIPAGSYKAQIVWQVNANAAQINNDTGGGWTSVSVEETD